MEWSTQIESGICMANLCEDWVDESFWRKAYNLSSGKEFRKTTWEFMNLNLNPMGYNFEDIYEPQQMARFNFHIQMQMFWKIISTSAAFPEKSIGKKLKTQQDVSSRTQWLRQCFRILSS